MASIHLPTCLANPFAARIVSGGLSRVAGALPLDGSNFDLREKLATKDGRVTEDALCYSPTND